MTTQQELKRPRAARARLSGVPAPSGASERRSAMSGLVHRALLSFGERDQQRRRLLNILLLIQALLLLASTPAYLGRNPSVPSLVVVGCGLLIYLTAWASNQFFRDVVRTTYLLLAGGGLVTLAQVFLAAALQGDAVSASFAAMLLLTIILEAGLLVSPEATGLVGTVAITLAAVGLVLAVTLGPASSQRQTYLMIATVLGLLVATALIAWLLSRFIADTAVEAERAHALQIAQVRLEGLSTQAAEQRRRMESGIAALRESITQAVAGETQIRANLTDGELAALVGPINLLLERMEMLGQADVMRRQLEAAGLPIGGANGIGAAQGELGAVQADLARRLLRIQEVAGEIVGGLAHTEHGLASTSQSASESLRTVGAARAAADGALTAAQKGGALAERARRLVSALLPGDRGESGAGEPVADLPDRLDAAQAAALLGLGSDLEVAGPDQAEQIATLGTGADAVAAEGPRDPATSGALPPGEPSETSEPSEASNNSNASAADGTTNGTGARRRKSSRSLNAEALQHLADLNRLLAQLQDEVARQERDATELAHELGLATRHARGVDVGVVWARQALEAVRRNAERLYQTTGGSATGFPGEGRPYSPPADMPRAPQPSRPLTQSGKLSALSGMARGIGESGGLATSAASTAHEDEGGVADTPPPDSEASFAADESSADDAAPEAES